MLYDTIAEAIEHASGPVEVAIGAGPIEFSARAVAARRWHGRSQILISQDGRLVWVDAHRIHLARPDAADGLASTTTAGTPTPLLG